MSQAAKTGSRTIDQHYGPETMHRVQRVTPAASDADPGRDVAVPRTFFVPMVRTTLYLVLSPRCRYRGAPRVAAVLDDV